MAAPACGGKTKVVHPAPPPPPKPSAEKTLAAARAAAQAGEIDAAHAKYKEAEQLEPSLAVVAEHVKFLLGNQRVELAVETSRGYYNAKPADLKGIAVYANTLIEAGDYATAVEVATELLGLDDSNPVGFELRGRATALDGKPDQAIADLSQAVTLSPKDANFLLSRAQGYLGASRLDEAALDVRQALTLDESARAQRLMGQVLRAQRQTQEALSWLLKATKTDPSDGEAWFQLALAQNDLGDNKEAETSAQKATAAAGHVARYWYAYGEMLRLNDRREDALLAYRKASELKPSYPKAPSKYARVLSDLGRNDEAVTWLNERIAVDDANPELYFSLGKAHAAQKQYAPAVAALQRYLELAPANDPLRKEATSDLKALRRKAR